MVPSPSVTALASTFQSVFFTVAVGKLKPLRKIKPEVPDLDELTNGTTNGHEY